MNPFTFVDDINVGKKNIVRNSENAELAEKEYNAFIINRAMSYNNDTIAHASEMNQRSFLPKIMQYEFYLNSVRKRKRFAKWHTKDKIGNLDVVKEYYGYSDAKAMQALPLLSDENIKQMKQTLEKGGKTR